MAVRFPLYNHPLEFSEEQPFHHLVFVVVLPFHFVHLLMVVRVVVSCHVAFVAKDPEGVGWQFSEPRFRNFRILTAAALAQRLYYWPMVKLDSDFVPRELYFVSEVLAEEYLPVIRRYCRQRRKLTAAMVVSAIGQDVDLMEGVEDEDHFVLGCHCFH